MDKNLPQDRYGGMSETLAKLQRNSNNTPKSRKYQYIIFYTIHVMMSK